MNDEVEAPNLDDPFEAHACWALAFGCDGCSAALDVPERPRQFSRIWFEEMAGQARKEGWTVDDPSGFGWYMDCYCPKCSAAPRKKKEPIQSPEPTAPSGPARPKLIPNVGKTNMKLAVLVLCGITAFVATSFAGESRAKDLIGSWKSNRELTVATIQVTPTMPADKRARFEKLFGTMVVTYTGSETTAVFPAFEKYPERVSKESYQVVAESPNRLLIRSKNTRTGKEETTAVNFVGKDRYWVALDGFKNLTGREYFDRVPNQGPKG